MLLTSKGYKLALCKVIQDSLGFWIQISSIHPKTAAKSLNYSIKDGIEEMEPFLTLHRPK